ncbi:hypothetical protein II898_02320 [bacterium]|nr:hypothetical protein [bacterium]
MKIINKISSMLLAVLFVALLTSCSEFMLIPISIDYPFEENNEASPATYRINITEGLNGIETIFNKELKVVTDTLFNELKIPDAQIMNYPQFKTDDILDLIAGKVVSKEIDFRTPMVDDLQHETMSFSICDFEDSNFEEKDEATNAYMTIANISSFCALSETVRLEEIDRCRIKADETCLHLEVRQENESMQIRMAEQKDLKKYKKYLNKIYSATLNELTFTIKNPPNNVAGNNAFRMKAELYAQSIDPFRADGTPCQDGDELKHCIYKGIDENGVPEDYFSATIEDDSATDGTVSEKKKYLIGVFETDDDTYSSEQVMNLIYTYEGKDTLQHAIKHLDFQLGIKSYYVFYPQAMKPEGTLEASIKAKLLFNVEPLN